MADDSRFVAMTDLIGNNWADEEQEQAPQPEPKKQPQKSAWGKVAEVQAIDIAKVDEEDKRKKAEAVEDKDWTKVTKEGPGNRPPPARQDYNERRYERRDNNNNGPSAERPRRERNPVPDQPPFSAFVGNLAFEVDEEALKVFFDGLEIKDVRVIREDGRSKGFGYVEFSDKSSLEKALTANGNSFKGRSLNIDVASTKSSGGKPKLEWGPGEGGSKFKSFGNRDRPPRDNYQNDGPSERPKLQIHPRTKPIENPLPAPAPKQDKPAGSSAPTPDKPKSSEDPFGGAAVSDKAKLDQQAQIRLKLEQEREQKRKEKLDSMNSNKDSYGSRGGRGGGSSGRGGSSYSFGRGEGSGNGSSSGSRGGRGGGRGRGGDRPPRQEGEFSAPKRERPHTQEKQEPAAPPPEKNIYSVLDSEGADAGNQDDE